MHAHTNTNTNTNANTNTNTTHKKASQWCARISAPADGGAASAKAFGGGIAPIGADGAAEPAFHARATKPQPHVSERYAIRSLAAMNGLTLVTLRPTSEGKPADARGRQDTV
jgi:hypothetical protein